MWVPYHLCMQLVLYRLVHENQKRKLYSISVIALFFPFIQMYASDVSIAFTYHRIVCTASLASYSFISSIFTVPIIRS